MPYSISYYPDTFCTYCMNFPQGTKHSFWEYNNTSSVYVIFSFHKDKWRCILVYESAPCSWWLPWTRSLCTASEGQRMQPRWRLQTITFLFLFPFPAFLTPVLIAVFFPRSFFTRLFLSALLVPRHAKMSGADARHSRHSSCITTSNEYISCHWISIEHVRPMDLSNLVQVKEPVSESEEVKLSPTILAQAGTACTEKASCRVCGKPYFSQGHNAARECHNPLLWVTTAFLSHWETLFSIITDHWELCCLKPEQEEGSTPLDGAEEPGFTIQGWGLRLESLWTRHSTSFLICSFQGNKAAGPPHGPDLYTQPCCEPNKAASLDFVWTLPFSKAL